MHDSCSVLHSLQTYPCIVGTLLIYLTQVCKRACPESFLIPKSLTPEVSTLYAVRTAKFVARKQWIVCGSDDMFVRVYNYNTMDKVKSFEAHTDYIRSIAVHPTQPYLLTCSDDMLIKLWDWDKVTTYTHGCS